MVASCCKSIGSGVAAEVMIVLSTHPHRLSFSTRYPKITCTADVSICCGQLKRYMVLNNSASALIPPYLGDERASLFQTSAPSGKNPPIWTEVYIWDPPNGTTQRSLAL